MNSHSHYYGNVVRRLFLLAGLIMLVTLPLLYENLPATISTAILIIFAIVAFAGFISPTQRWAIALNVFVAAGALVVFEYYAVTARVAENKQALFFWTNQALALVFFFALYYGTKTLRGSVVAHRDPISSEVPLEVLKIRYAEGKLTKEEFEEKAGAIRKF